MQNAMWPTGDPKWTLTHEGYGVLTESAFKSRLAMLNLLPVATRRRVS